MALHSGKIPSSGTLDGYLSQIACGDSRGMDALYQAAAPGVYAYALSVLKDPYNAEDVLQDTFLRILDSASSYRSQGKPMAWILTITRNLCYKRLADQQRYGALPLADWCETVDTSSQLTRDDALVIRACLKELSDEEQQIVLLHAVSGFKHREIAAMLDMKLSTVLSKYNRAMKKLKANF